MLRDYIGTAYLPLRCYLTIQFISLRGFVGYLRLRLLAYRVTRLVKDLRRLANT